MTTDRDLLSQWLTLSHVPRLGAVRIHSLLQHFSSPAEILQADRQHLIEAGLSEKLADNIRHPEMEKVENDLAWLEQENAHILTLDDARYPPLLKNLPDAPPLLYLLGEVALLNMPQLAIVGSRNPSHGGREMAYDFARHLCRMGLSITSGMAEGIDTAAHRGALDAMKGGFQGHGFTIAVTGTGLDRVYPAKNRELAHEIAEQGLLVSEYAPGTPPAAGHFPRRNRIISGLSMGVLVVEAALQSGSLITARLATEQGREVFAIPGSVHQPLAKGCHALIREGAKLVETADHILEELRGIMSVATASPVENSEKAVQNGKNEPNALVNVDEEYQQVLNCIDFEPTSVDKVVERSGLTADAVCSMLLVLELQGYVTALSGGYYCQGR